MKYRVLYEDNQFREREVIVTAKTPEAAREVAINTVSNILCILGTIPLR